MLGDLAPFTPPDSQDGHVGFTDGNSYEPLRPPIDHSIPDFEKTGVKIYRKQTNAGGARIAERTN